MKKETERRVGTLKIVEDRSEGSRRRSPLTHVYGATVFTHNAPFLQELEVEAVKLFSFRGFKQLCTALDALLQNANAKAGLKRGERGQFSGCGLRSGRRIPP